jgi:hypothetical protein
MQSVPNITKDVSGNLPTDGELYSIQHDMIHFVSDSTPVSSTNKADRQDITEILLTVALNTIAPTDPDSCNFICFAYRSSLCKQRNVYHEQGTRSVLYRRYGYKGIFQ